MPPCVLPNSNETTAIQIQRYRFVIQRSSGKVCRIFNNGVDIESTLLSEPISQAPNMILINVSMAQTYICLKSSNVIAGCAGTHTYTHDKTHGRGRDAYAEQSVE